MDDREIARYGLDSLLKAGGEKGQCELTLSERHELDLERDEFSLLRTTYDANLDFLVIRDSRRGTASSNKTDRESIDKAAADVLEIAGASQPDDAYDIAEEQETQAFASGSAEPDLDRMFDRLKSFIQTAKERYPHTVVNLATLDFTHSQSRFANTNGVDFTTSKGIYHFVAIFTSKEGEKISSMNHTEFTTRELDRELLECGATDLRLRQSAEQLELQSVDGKFIGDLIISPETLADFINAFTGISLRDGPLIAGTSIFEEKLNEQIASANFTLHAKPVSDEIADNNFVTADGYRADNSTVIEKGIFKSFLLSLYGSKKTGRERAVNDGNSWIVDPGDLSFDEMVKSVERGLLLCRSTGGFPSDSGDFSGVAKNSYYIEGGEVKYPVSETTISGNLAEMFGNIQSISRERIDYGDKILPWLWTSGTTISGK